ncbi:hypothetical protein, partial [Methylobacter psychrophilus]
MADFADRSLGIGYAGGTAILFTLLIVSLFIWYRAMGSVAVDTVSSPKSEMFYWIIIMFSQTLGTALGDWTADTAGLGYGGGAMVFGTMLAVIAVAYFRTKISHTILFWAAFILTRPLGAICAVTLSRFTGEKRSGISSQNIFLGDSQTRYLKIFGAGYR